MTPTDTIVLDEGALERLLRIGGQAFVLEMIELFLEHGPQRLEAARGAVAAGDYQTLYRAAHSLKSTAGNLGARRLQATAERLESRALARADAEIGPLLGEIGLRYDEVRERLETERDRRQAQTRGTP